MESGSLLVSRQYLIRMRDLLLLSVAVLIVAFPSMSGAAPEDVIKPGYTKNVCDKGVCRDVYFPPFPNAGACTRYFRAFHLYDDSHEDQVTVCLDFMGVNKYCDDRDAYVTVGYVDAPGTWHGKRRILQCTPKYHPDSIDEQLLRITVGIGEGLITAAPFVAEGVLGLTCIYGQIYACAVLALQVSEQAGLEIPDEIEDAVYIAGKAPACINGDVVACAYLGARGAKAVGLEIPGISAISVVEDSQLCSDGDFMACARLGKEAAEAGGIETGAAFGSFVDAESCLDGDDNACFELAQEAIRDQVPLNGVPEGIDNARACDAGSDADCIKLGKTLASAATGLIVAAPTIAPFGANACSSDSGATGPVDLASVWDDHSATSIAVFPNDGSRFTAPFQASRRNGGWALGAKWAAADFTGDGLTDILAIWDDQKNNTLTLRQSTDTGFTIAHWIIKAGTWVSSTVWLPGDFDGDGRTDIAAVWKDQNETSIAVYVSDGARFRAPVQWSQRNGGWGDTVKWAVGDFTGDGKADIAAVWDNGGTNTITVRQSTGSGFTPVHWASNAGGWNESSVWLAGDFNGDRKLDLAGVWRDGNAVSIVVFPSSGGQFSGWTQWSQRHGSWMDQAKWTSGDFNGDGKTDIASTWNNNGTNTITVRQSTGSSFVDVHWANNAGGWSPSAAWCTGQFPDGISSQYAQSDDRIAADTAVAQPTTVKAQGRVKLAGAPAVTPTTPMSLCNSARIAKGRNSPAAPGLEQQCLAQGGSVVVAPPVDAAQLEALALRGGPIAAADPLAAALRAQQTVPAGQRGFDIGMAATENQTAMGPGKQNTHDSLAKDEQYGYYEAVTFSLQRNSHRDLAATGAAIDRADPAVAAARDANPNVFYQLGFDIATGLFGDPALGALGNTLMGPGSEKIRSSLNADAQLGFDASVTFHQGRDYTH